MCLFGLFYIPKYDVPCKFPSMVIESLTLHLFALPSTLFHSFTLFLSHLHYFSNLSCTFFAHLYSPSYSTGQIVSFPSLVPVDASQFQSTHLSFFSNSAKSTFGNYPDRIIYPSMDQ